MAAIKILIADDHPLMREALLTALEEEPEFEVVAEASNGLEAVEFAVAHNPDVVLMDLLMPGMDGLGAIAKLQAEQPEIKIMVVSSLESEEKILAAVQAGALGYFPKTASRAHLLDAIRDVAAGTPYLPDNVAKKLFKGLREMKTLPATDDPDTRLTPRQTQILALLGEGRSDTEIAHYFHITEATVRTHVHHILQRLDLDSRAQVVAYANRQQRPD
jgi:DNA-binding NarL/FixJ family response regulator